VEPENVRSFGELIWRLDLWSSTARSGTSYSFITWPIITCKGERFSLCSFPSVHKGVLVLRQSLLL
jgi:hypothetical protein